ncbi:MAG: hypothetical protein V7647_3305 [Acidobacteriota bacterium]|jgi:CubicO group peptidase (beta-lactamase class C family)
MLRPHALLLLLLSIATPSASYAQAQRASTAPAAQQAFAPDRLARIDTVFNRYVDEARIGGAVVLVLRDGRPVYERAFGWSDKESGRRMAPDSIFRIASQSKALTSVGILSLMEEGKLALTDPVSLFIPAFAKTTVLVEKDGAVSTIPAKRAITIRDLLTHTAGISYGTGSAEAPLYQAKGLGPAAGFGWYTADKDEPICDTMERLASLPFAAHPGESYVYGYNTDILGCVIERASGIPLDRFLAQRITEPLHMQDTQFYLLPSQHERLTAVYASGPDGRITRAPDGARGQGHYVEGPRKSFAGGAGLLSTARDYARFLEMIRNGGALDGVRILSPRSVALMTTNQVGTLHSATGLGFGLGFETTDRYGAAGLASVGSYGWGGAYGSSYRVDPDAGVVMLLMIQLLPSNSDITAKFPTLVYQALVDEPRRGTQ